MRYGETAISLPYVRERWGELFDLVEVKAIPEDLYQVAITLRKRSRVGRQLHGGSGESGPSPGLQLTT